MENNMIAVVNPITRVATILHYVNECLYERELHFKELDEWSGFETDREYEVHFCYDEVFRLYICEDDTDAEYHGLQNVEFIPDVVYSDFDYKQAIYFNTLKLQSNEQA